MTASRPPRHDAPRLPPDLAALAARLERAPAPPPRPLRERVLGGVIDALAEPEDACRDRLPPPRAERWREAIVALAALVALLLAGPWLAALAAPPAKPGSPRGPVASGASVASIGALAAAWPPAPPALAIHRRTGPLPAAPSALVLRTGTPWNHPRGDFR